MTKLRTGRKNPHTLYLQVGDEPVDSDPPVGFILDPEVAKLICESSISPWHLNEMKLSFDRWRGDLASRCDVKTGLHVCLDGRYLSHADSDAVQDLIGKGEL